MAYDYNGGCPMLGGGFGGVGMIMGIVIWALVIAGIVWLAVWLMKNYSSQQKSAGRDETPMEILRRRYAEGELTSKEFEERKKELHKKQ